MPTWFAAKELSFPCKRKVRRRRTGTKACFEVPAPCASRSCRRRTRCPFTGSMAPDLRGALAPSSAWTGDRVAYFGRGAAAHRRCRRANARPRRASPSSAVRDSDAMRQAIVGCGVDQSAPSQVTSGDGPSSTRRPSGSADRSRRVPRTGVPSLRGRRPCCSWSCPAPGARCRRTP